jgi:hypothetical protein
MNTFAVITYPKGNYTRVNNEDICNENIIYHQAIAPRKYDQDVIDSLKPIHSLINLPQNAIYGPSIMNYNGIFYISTYPIDFIEEDNLLKIGRYFCVHCLKHGSYNGVFIGLCTMCAANPKLNNIRGSGFSYIGTETNPLHVNSACNTYLKSIRFDMIGCRELCDTEDEVEHSNESYQNEKYIETRKLLQQTGQLVAFGLYSDAIAMYTLYNLEKISTEELENSIMPVPDVILSDTTSDQDENVSEEAETLVETLDNSFLPLKILFKLILYFTTFLSLFNTFTMHNTKKEEEYDDMPELEPISEDEDDDDDNNNIGYDLYDDLYDGENGYDN